MVDRVHHVLGVEAALDAGDLVVQVVAVVVGVQAVVMAVVMGVQVVMGHVLMRVLELVLLAVQDPVLTHAASFVEHSIGITVQLG